MDALEIQKTENDSLMEELVKNSKKQLFHARVRTACAVLLVSVVMICAVVIVPRLLVTIQSANDIMTQASETITLANTAIEDITDMSDSITTMGENLDTFITDNSETVAAGMEEIEGIDFEGLNTAIEDLGEVVEPLANFFGKFN